MRRSKTDIPARYVLALLGFLGFFNVYAMRVNLSVAMVAMVRNVVDPSLNSTKIEACAELIPKISTNLTLRAQEIGEFDWDTKTQALILGSFFYGYIVTQIPGGVMAEIFGGKWLYGIGVLVTSVFTLLTPLAARMGVPTFIVVRIIEGLGEGVTFPAMNSLIAKWVPKCERSRMATIIFTGSQVGTVVAMPLSGLLSSSTFFGGWPSVFYVFGTLGCIWFIFWALLIHDTPSKHPRISASELMYIKNNQEASTNVRPIPWKSILTSVPVWALALTHFGQNWGFYTLLTELPTYLSNILHFDIQKNGMLSSVPYILQAVCAWLTSFLADKLRSQGNLKITTIRKILNSIGFFGPGLCILTVIFVGCRPNLIVAILAVTMGINGFIYSGFNVTHVDMSPKYAGILMGITNTVASLSGFLGPAAVGWVVEDEQTRKNWSKVFIITSAVYFVTGIIYDIFCTVEALPWGTSSDEENHNAEILKVRTVVQVPSIPAKN